VDQRRVIAFLAISVLVLILFAPKQKPPKKGAAENALPPAANQLAKPPADQPEKAGEKPPAQPDLEDQASPVEQPANKKRADEGPADEKPAVEHNLKYASLGSVDADSPYRVLVTFTNHGAGVRRVELASPRYRDLHDRGGYLGHLEAAADSAGGVLVQTVGAGTPAAKAGLKIGDRIVSANSEGKSMTIDSPEQLAELLAQNKPGEHLQLQVSQDGAPPADLTVSLARRPLEVIRPESENVLMRSSKLPAHFPAPPSFRLTLERAGSSTIKRLAEQDLEDRNIKAWEDGAEPEIAGVELRNSNWEVLEQNETSVTFRKQIPKYSLEVLKHYHLEPIPTDQLANQDYPAYGLKLDIEIRNLGESEFEIAYRLDGPNGLPAESWWFANKISRKWTADGLRDVVARYQGSSTVQFGPSEIIKKAPEPLQGPPLAYMGVDAQYFSAVLLPIKPSLDEKWIDEARLVLLSPKPEKPIEGRYANVTCRLVSQPLSIAAGGSLKHSYQIFTGPKRPELLSQYQACESPQYSLDDLLYYGWFGGVAKVMLAVLHFFYAITGNYGIAIIMLTVLVRSCMFPISRKQAQSMAKMQLLKPEMDRMKEKYKNDMQKQSQAMQELYRKHNINPLAGCQPMFLQLPIFLGLYRSLMVDVELRQAPLLSESIRWCSNLAAPDMFYDWTSFMPTIITSGQGIMVLGPYLNILPLITISLFMLQQKLFMPDPANEQAAMQQKIMKFMMLFMGLLFFKVASGLCLYFIASSTWGIAERKLLPKPATPDTMESSPTKSLALGESKNGQSKSSRAKKKKKRR